MTDRELMQQALDALEHLYPRAVREFDGEKVQSAVDALRARLAQLEPPCKTGSQCIGGKCVQCAQPEPEQREWQGLTDEEFREAWGTPLTELGIQCAKRIEAKLKEKNSAFDK